MVIISTQAYLNIFSSNAMYHYAIQALTSIWEIYEHQNAWVQILAPSHGHVPKPFWVYFFPSVIAHR